MEFVIAQLIVAVPCAWSDLVSIYFVIFARTARSRKKTVFVADFIFADRSDSVKKEEKGILCRILVGWAKVVTSQKLFGWIFRNLI